MKNHRRTFLKAAGLAGVAIAAGGAGRAGRPGIVMSTAQAASSQSGELPKGMTFTMLRRADGYGLGVRTERGILDVVAAEKDFAAGAPTTITAVLNGTGDWQKLYKPGRIP